MPISSCRQGALGVVVFAHGSGSSRHSSRNRAVARVLQQSRFATLLMDLLTPVEERSTSTRAIFASTSPCWRAGW